MTRETTEAISKGKPEKPRYMEWLNASHQEKDKNPEVRKDQSQEEEAVGWVTGQLLNSEERKERNVGQRRNLTFNDRRKRDRALDDEGVCQQVNNV